MTKDKKEKKINHAKSINIIIKEQLKA